MSIHSRTPASALVALLTLLSAASATAQDPCAEGTPVEPGDVVRGVQWASAPQCYTIDVVRPGTLLLAVSAAQAAEPRLDVFECRGGDGGSPAVRVRDRWAASWLGDVPPGRYAVCVAAQDPERRLAGFKLTTAFAERLATKGGDPDEDEPEPEHKCAFGKGGDPDEDEPEPEVPQNLVADEPLCRSVAADDHADLYRCATPVAAGETLDAEIANGWGDDEDVFLLPLGRLATVRLTVAGEDGIRAALYDRFGNRLMIAETEDEAGLYLTKTLVRGFYFIRVSSPDATEGAYRLQVAVP